MTFREFVPHNTGLSIITIPREALFLAGKVFLHRPSTNSRRASRHCLLHRRFFYPPDAARPGFAENAAP